MRKASTNLGKKFNVPLCVFCTDKPAPNVPSVDILRASRPAAAAVAVTGEPSRWQSA
jgi:hypothetical protein